MKYAILIREQDALFRLGWICSYVHHMQMSPLGVNEMRVSVVITADYGQRRPDESTKATYFAWRT